MSDRLTKAERDHLRTRPATCPYVGDKCNTSKGCGKCYFVPLLDECDALEADAAVVRDRAEVCEGAWDTAQRRCDVLRADLNTLAYAHAAVVRERDEARAELIRAERTITQAIRAFNEVTAERDEALSRFDERAIEAWGERILRLEAERDEARRIAEGLNAQLRDEVMNYCLGLPWEADDE